MPAQAIVPYSGAPSFTPFPAMRSRVAEIESSRVTSHWWYETFSFDVFASFWRDAHSNGEGAGRMSMQAAWPPASTTASARVIPKPLPPPVIAIVRLAREKSLLIAAADGVSEDSGMQEGSAMSLTTGSAMLPILNKESVR